MKQRSRSHKQVVVYVLHGWALGPGNAEKWQSFADVCLSQDIILILLEIPGLDAPLSATWTMDTYIDWLSKQLPAEPCFLLGHSFGGQLSLFFVRQFPDRVRGLLLIDSSGIRDTRLKIRCKRAVFGTLAKIGKHLTKSEQARDWLYQLTREKDYLQAPPELRATMSNVLLADVESIVSAISTPSLILWGENDTVTPPWMGKLLYELLQHATLKIVPGARHSPQFTHSQVVADQVARWIGKVVA